MGYARQVLEARGSSLGRTSPQAAPWLVTRRRLTTQRRLEQLRSVANPCSRMSIGLVRRPHQPGEGTDIYGHDGLGRLTFISYPDDQATGTSYEYDLLERLRFVRHPDGSFIERAYQDESDQGRSRKPAHCDQEGRLGARQAGRVGASQARVRKIATGAALARSGRFAQAGRPPRSWRR